MNTGCEYETLNEGAVLENPVYGEEAVISFLNYGKVIMKIKPDGTIEVGEGLSEDEATQRVARLLAEAAPDEFLREIARRGL